MRDCGQTIFSGGNGVEGAEVKHWYSFKSKDKKVRGYCLAKGELGMANWIEVHDGDDRARGLFNRHYSRHHYKDGRKPRLFVGPGEKMVLLTLDCRALFIWRKFIELGEVEPKGVNCAVFRNESEILSSKLILEAEQLAWQRWPNERLYTYVNPRKIRSSNPGFCFLKAGWQRVGLTKGNLNILEKQPEVARFAGHPISELVIERVRGHGEEFGKNGSQVD